MRRMKITVAALCVVGALVPVGCGFTASPADGLRFQAPPNWQSSPGIMGFMQFWRPPSGRGEALMLFKSPKTLRPSDVLSSGTMGGGLKSISVRNETGTKICGDQPATFLDGTAKNDRGDAIVDMMLTNVKGTSYMAMYVYPVDRAPNPLAIAALREICAKS